MKGNIQMKVRTILSAVVAATALVCASAFAESRSWTGNAGDGKWSTPGNWSGETVPAKGDTVSIGASSGGTLDMDIAGLTLFKLGYTADAGTYAVGGGALGITSVLTSSALVTQTISAPVNLGEASADPMAVGGSGAINLTGATSFLGRELVKTGTGTFTTTEGAVYGPQKITVEDGTFKIGARGSTYVDGSKYYPGSLSVDANNPTLLWRDTQLSDVVGVSARPGTWTMGWGDVMCPFYWTNDGETATVQFQKVRRDTAEKLVQVVFVTFKQIGPHVYAYTTKARYVYDYLPALGCNWDASGLKFTPKSIGVVGPNVTNGGYNVRDVMPIFKENGKSPWVTGYVPYEKEQLVWTNTRLADVVCATVDAIGRSGYYNPGPWQWTNNGTTATVQFQNCSDGSTRSILVRLRQIGNDVYAQAVRACYTKPAENIVGTDMSTGYTDYTANSSETKGYAVQNIRPVFNKAPGSEASFVVKDGGRLDVNVDQGGGGGTLQKSESTHGKVIYVEGDGPDSNGVLYNSNGSQTHGASFGHIVLTGDATIGGTGRMDLRPLSYSAVAALENSAILEGPYVLTLKQGGRFGIYQATLDLDRFDVAGTLSLEGTIQGTVANGIRLFDGSKLLFGSGAALTADMPILASGAQTEINNTVAPAVLPGDLTVDEDVTLSVTGTKAVQIGGAVRVDGTLAVSCADGLVLQGSLEGKGTVSGNVAFEGDDFTWRVSANAESLTASVNLDGAVTSNPDLLKGIKRIEAVFAAKPVANFRQRLASAGNLTAEDIAVIDVESVGPGDETMPKMKLVLSGGDLMLCANDENAPVTVHWTGGGNVTNPADPNNWACTNATGRAVPGAIPTEDSTVYLSHEIAFNCPVGASFVCKKLLLDGTPTLTADCDWRGLNLQYIGEGGAVDLNGHDLALLLSADIPNVLTVTDSRAPGKGGALRLEVPAGVTATNEKLVLAGSAKLVKDGEGALLATEGTVYAPQEITAEDGTVKVGARASAYADRARYYPGSLSPDANNPTLLWRDTQLADVVGVSARPGSGTMDWGGVMCPFCWQNGGTTASVQFQKVQGGKYIMTVFVSFKQVGPHVYAWATKARNTENDLSSLGSDWNGVSGTDRTVVGPNVSSGGYNVRDVMPILKENGESPWVSGCIPYEKENKDGILVWKNTRLADVVCATADSMPRSGFYNPGSWQWQNDGQTATVQFQKFSSITRCVTVRLMQKGADVWAVAIRAAYADTNIVGKDLSKGYTDYTGSSSSTGGYAVQNIRPVFNKAPGSEASFVVKDGGRLDVNVDQGNASSLQKTESTHGKVVYVEGDGPDANGAIYNSNDSQKLGATFGHIVLTGDASFGGAGRMDLRPLLYSAVASSGDNAILEGPYALTLKGGDLGLYNTTLDLDRIDVASMLSLQEGLLGAVTNGIHLLAGSVLRFAGDASVTLPVAMPLYADAQAELRNEVAKSGAALEAVLAGGLTVDETAELSVTGNGAVKVGGAVRVEGVLSVTNPDGLVLQNSLEGNGAVSGNVAFEGDDFTWKVVADADGLVSSVDLDAAIKTNPDLLAGLRKVEVVFETKPDESQKWERRLASQGNLTAEDASAIVVEAFDADGEVMPGAKVTLADGGLVLCANDGTIPVKAYWTGAGDLANLADSNNWNCVNAFGDTLPEAIPTANSTVYLTEGIAFACPVGAPFACKEIVLEAALAADCDWRGLDLDLIAAGGKLDLNGHNLTLALKKDVAKALTVTDSQEVGGELHLEVPVGVTAKNELLALTGSLKLVKDGAGTFTAAKTQQTYVGGTEIAEGLVNLPTCNNDLTYSGETGLFGPVGSTFTIRKDGVFDICGNYVYHSYATVLDGGILRNSVKQYTFTWNSCCNITLQSDSRLEALDDTIFYVSGGVTTKPVNLNGFTLAVKIGSGKHLYMCGFGAFANGTVNFDTDGWFHPYPCGGHKDALDLTSVTVVGRAALWADLEVKFGNLTVKRNDTYFTANKASSIFGVFTPETAYWKDFTMMDGSTLNLSGATLPFSISSSLTKDTLKFAENAKIKVDLTGKVVKSKSKVLSWTTKPTNVKFKIVDGSGKYDGRALSIEDDGAYLGVGFTLLVR